jgi:hypothetical protein
MVQSKNQRNDFHHQHFRLPELTETLPLLTPQGNGLLHGFINSDMTG